MKVPSSFYEQDGDEEAAVLFLLDRDETDASVTGGFHVSFREPRVEAESEAGPNLIPTCL